MNKEVDIPILLDLYGKILSRAQYSDLDSYYNQDLSLSEIADNVGKTRQGVFDSIKRAESTLTDTENKLGFLSKITEMRKDFSSIEKILKGSENENPRDKTFLKDILKITEKYKNE